MGGHNSTTRGNNCFTARGEGENLVVPHICSSIYKSVKKFYYRIAFDAPSVWNRLTHAVHAASSIDSLQEES